MHIFNVPLLLHVFQETDCDDVTLNKEEIQNCVNTANKAAQKHKISKYCNYATNLSRDDIIKFRNVKFLVGSRN